MERIAGEVGFGSPTSFRDLFKMLVGISPRDYRRVFGGFTSTLTTRFVAQSGRWVPAEGALSTVGSGSSRIRRPHLQTRPRCVLPAAGHGSFVRPRYLPRDRLTKKTRVSARGLTAILVTSPMGGSPVSPGFVAPRSVSCPAKADACSQGAGSVVVLEARPCLFERQLRVSADVNG